MYGVPHKIITMGSLLLAGAPLEVIVGGGVGSTLPDLDKKIGIAHRTWTHWWPLYILPGGFFLFLLYFRNLDPSSATILRFSLGLVLGGLLHILEDSITKMGIPVFSPNGKRFSLSLTTSGGVLEKIIALGVILSCIIYIRDGYGETLFIPFLSPIKNLHLN